MIKEINMRKSKGIIITAVVLFVVLIAVGLFLKFKSRDIPQNHIYSHRGAPAYAVEHTYESYDIAIAQGTKFIEQDLVISKDGTLYISHDLSAKRITGTDKEFSNMTDNEIEELRTLNDEKIHKLSDIFERYGKNINYVIEFKDGKTQINPFVGLVDKYGLKEKIIVQSRHIEVLEELEKIYPKMKKLFLVYTQEQIDDVAENKDDYSFVDIVSVNEQFMTKENCKKIQKADKEFNVWTLNTEEQIKKAIETGVDTYFTDATDVAIAAEKKYRK